MWMTMDANNEYSREFKLPADPVIGRKLRPLMPRPISSSSSSPYSTPPCCCIRNPNILSWNHSMSDSGVKREIQTTPVSTRWNPTAEQLQALEEMYRRGIRTPSAEQIQQIAAKLGRFGKIEGKNVFYWFQNHKARERQKKRRQLDLLAAKKMHQTGVSRRYLEIENHKKVPVASNCSTASVAASASASEDSASMHGAVIAAESGKDGWNHKELQHNIATATAENETGCWPLHNLRLHLYLSSSLPLPTPNNYSPPPPPPPPSINAHKSTGQENTNPYASITMLNEHQLQHEVVQDQTLDLFPTPTPPGQNQPHHTSTIGTKIMPGRFIEFLPIKN